MLDKMETGWGHLGRPVEHSEGKGGESAVVILRFLCGSPRLCRLRTEGLVPVSKYWTYRSHDDVYGPGKASSWLPTYAWLCPWLARKRNWIWTHRSINRRAMDCVRSPFSREQWRCSNLLMTTWKVATYGDCPHEAYTGHTWTGMGSVRVVLIRFSPVWCTSIRITVTLRYE
jgi:hypothetical protein